MRSWGRSTVNPIPPEFPKLYIKAKQKASAEWAGFEVSMEKKLWTETGGRLLYHGVPSLPQQSNHVICNPHSVHWAFWCLPPISSPMAPHSRCASELHPLLSCKNWEDSKSQTTQTALSTSSFWFAESPNLVLFIYFESTHFKQDSRWCWWSQNYVLNRIDIINTIHIIQHTYTIIQVF